MADNKLLNENLKVKKGIQNTLNASIYLTYKIIIQNIEEKVNNKLFCCRCFIVFFLPLMSAGIKSMKLRREQNNASFFNIQELRNFLFKKRYNHKNTQASIGLLYKIWKHGFEYHLTWQQIAYDNEISISTARRLVNHLICDGLLLKVVYKPKRIKNGLFIQKA